MNFEKLEKEPGGESNRQSGLHAWRDMKVIRLSRWSRIMVEMISQKLAPVIA